MRIVIDMQGLQTESRFRGIGRYALSFAQAVAKYKGQHEVILVLNGYYPHTITPIREAFKGILPQKNIVIWQAPGPVSDIDATNRSRQQVSQAVREAFLTSLQPDIIHIISLFEGYNDDAITDIGNLHQHARVTLTFYDLIPLLNPEQYLTPDPNYARYYNGKIDSLDRAHRYFAISEFARQEGIAHLAVDAEHIVNVSTAIEAVFQPVTVSTVEAEALQKKWGIKKPFVLYTGGADERKNLPGLIKAYVALPKAVRQSHQLLFVGKIPEGVVTELSHLAKTQGLEAEELIFTGYVTDEELIQLYNLCKLFVFPSWHEGFGLPALEAMACGAAVIGSNTSSLPEVIGLKEALFDPFDVETISQKMAQALEDEVFLNTLREHGLQQSRLFSWDAVAQTAISTWEQLYAEECVDESAPAVASLPWSEVLTKAEQRHRALISQLATILAAEKSTFDDEELRWLAICLERNEQQLLSFLRVQPLGETLTWRLEGPFDSSYSLALLNRETARALEALGHTVILHSTEGPGDFTPNAAFLKQNPDIAAMYESSKKEATVSSDVMSRNLYPPRVADMTGRINLLHNYNWEETGFPVEWVEAFNQSLQGVLVATEHVKKVLIDNGVTVPLAVSGVGTDHWEAIDAEHSVSLDAAPGFRFLHVSSCFPRKGVDSLLAAYGQAFTDQDEVSLIIKTFDNPHNETQRWLSEVKQKQPNFPHVVILEGDYSDAEIKGLYEQCDALVAPSRAEGFGLPMAEAMLSGLPVITTGWSGQTDFCTPETAWLVDYEFARADTHFNLYSSVWAEPSVAHLAQVMREVYELPAAARERRVRAGRELLLNNLRWTQVAERMVAGARQWSQGTEAVDPRIGWISSWNTPCGIATYSEKLINAMPEVQVFAAYASSLTAVDQPYVSRCWAQGDDNLQALREAIAAADIDTLVVQFNYGFFDLAQLATFLEQQIDAGVKVAVMMHATTDPIHDPTKKLSTLVPALARCDRILVHSPHDMNRLKAYGLIDNVMLFPHGILDFEPESKPSAAVDKASFVVASYGFFLPHKGLVELIEAVGLLQQQGESIRLEMVNAEYPNPISAQIIAEAKEIIQAAQVEDVVNMCTDYLEDEECLRRLAAADLVVFPYQDTGESSSAAVRYGIASGTSVAVTPLAIFEDVDDAVFHLDGQSVAEIAAGIKSIRNEMQKNSPLAQQVAKANEQWRNQHRYSVVGQRLFNTLFALRNESR